MLSFTQSFCGLSSAFRRPGPHLEEERGGADGLSRRACGSQGPAQVAAVGPQLWTP